MVPAQTHPRSLLLSIPSTGMSNERDGSGVMTMREASWVAACLLLPISALAASSDDELLQMDLDQLMHT